MILPARRGRDETVSFLFLNQGPEDLAELFGWVGIQSQHAVLRVVFIPIVVRRNCRALSDDTHTIAISPPINTRVFTATYDERGRRRFRNAEVSENIEEVIDENVSSQKEE